MKCRHCGRSGFTILDRVSYTQASEMRCRACGMHSAVNRWLGALYLVTESSGILFAALFSIFLGTASVLIGWLVLALAARIWLLPRFARPSSGVSGAISSLRRKSRRTFDRSAGE